MNHRRPLALLLASIPIAVCLAVPPPARPEAAKPIPAAAKAALTRTLASAFRALPAPAKDFHEDREGGLREIAAGTSAWAVATKAPAEAKQVRVYERTVGEGDDAETVPLEVRVYVNLERALPEPLGSEGGALETFTHDGLPGMRASLAGVGASRVALPLSPEEMKDALTVVRLHVGAAEATPYLDEIAQGRRPPRTPWDERPARKASDVRTIVVEFQGPRAEVDRLAAAVKAAPL
ncbi:MAG TPA: hypothetical protein VFU59_12335, partial [Candidatus Eisenbacteria bacterium]|nr:hypothetical protein [Candidatus Eisenbacteria bacterium]